jgi:UDP-N-acetylglucosamine 2-epimerase
VAAHPSAQLVDNLGTQAYFSLMSEAAAMVGNSSSGIIEAASFNLPVVNIGNRQKGRVRGANVIDVGYSREDIIEGIEKALRTDFRAILSGMSNPYGDGAASERIVARLKDIPLDRHLLVKQFQDIEIDASTKGSAVS